MAVETYDAKQLAVTAWALALLDVSLGMPFRVVWAEIGRRACSSEMAELPKPALRQIHQARIFVLP